MQRYRFVKCSCQAEKKFQCSRRHSPTNRESTAFRRAADENLPESTTDILVRRSQEVLGSPFYGKLISAARLKRQIERRLPAD